jgi:glycosyltransferase involved in cell wall biosynthesis
VVLVYTRIMNNTSPYKIGIDCRLSGNAHAGIGRYIEELILRLPKIGKDKHWVLFFYSKQQANDLLEKIVPKPSNIDIVIAPIKHYSFTEQIKMPRIFAQQSLDLLHIPHFNAPIFYRGKLVVTIHDLLWHEFRGLNVTTLKPYLYYFKYWAYRFITKISIKKADQIIVPAQTIKKTVLKYYPWAKKKISVTKEGHSKKFKPSLGKNLQNINKVFLYVGSLYPHKNISVVLKALKSLPDYRLEIIGSRSVFQDHTKMKIMKLDVCKQVDFLGYISDEELNKKMSQSFALIQPSLSEGFGLTGIESMAAGLPVIASDIPIFKEIYQDGAVFFDPEYPTDFVRAVDMLEKINRIKLIKKALKVADGYSWDNMAEQTLNVYQS